MAAITTNTSAHHAPRPARRSLFQRFDAFFTDLARARSCASEYEHLAALSDEQLAARGLRRTVLVRHVARAYL